MQVVFSDRDAYVLEQLSNVNPDGSYSYVYKTSNGINAEGNLDMLFFLILLLNLKKNYSRKWKRC